MLTITYYKSTKIKVPESCQIQDGVQDGHQNFKMPFSGSDPTTKVWPCLSGWNFVAFGLFFVWIHIFVHMWICKYNMSVLSYKPDESKWIEGVPFRYIFLYILQNSNGRIKGAVKPVIDRPGPPWSPPLEWLDECHKLPQCFNKWKLLWNKKWRNLSFNFKVSTLVFQDRRALLTCGRMWETWWTQLASELSTKSWIGSGSHSAFTIKFSLTTPSSSSSASSSNV